MELFEWMETLARTCSVVAFAETVSTGCLQNLIKALKIQNSK